MADSYRVLIVDDDPNVLKAYERRLRKRFDIETALCSEEGIMALNILGPFAVVVSDMQMPRENGVQFLERVFQSTPECVRIMLTGNADQDTAAAAINQGHVFRFLNKPCDAEVLAQAIQDGIEEHQQRIAQTERLRQTLLGAVQVMSDIISTVCPAAYDRAERLRSLLRRLSSRIGLERHWQVETAGLLSQLGWISAPDKLLRRYYEDAELSEEEQAIVARRHEAAADIIAQVPALQDVSDMVRAIGSQTNDDRFTEEVHQAAQLIQLAEAYDRQTNEHNLHPLKAIEQLQAQLPADFFGLDALTGDVADAQTQTLTYCKLADLPDGGILAEDVTTVDGALLAARGLEVTSAVRDRLINYATRRAINQPIGVMVNN